MTDKTTNGKARTRFGVKLPWPVANAFTFVAYLSADQYDKAYGAISVLKGLFPQATAMFIEQG